MPRLHLHLAHVESLQLRRLQNPTFAQMNWALDRLAVYTGQLPSFNPENKTVCTREWVFSVVVLHHYDSAYRVSVILYSSRFADALPSS